MRDSFKQEYLGQFMDATTYDKLAVPNPNSDCLNCGKPGTVHVDGKCLFEASQFEASEHHYPYAKVPVGSPSPAISSAFSGWSKVWRK